MSHSEHINDPCNLYLMGFMGSGKSFLGRQLAAYLNWNFIDLDQQIEKTAGLSIQDIFKQKGEDYFRELEQSELLATSSLSHTIIATGGGTPCFFDNIKWINTNGKSVYLKVSSTILLGRLQDDRIDRPLLNDMNLDELSDFVKHNLSEREHYYNQAHLIVEADITSATLLNSIVELCKKNGDAA